MNRFDTARKFATNIAKDFNLTPPIDPIEIIKNYGIDIIEEENKVGIEAYSKLTDNPCIIINPEFTFPARKNFTLSHELGHIVIPWHNGDTKFNTDTSYIKIAGKSYIDTQELEANLFASELLIPSEWVKSQIPNEKINLKDTLENIQKIAQTSVMACMYALENALPKGHLFYVKADYNEYWKKFIAPSTNIGSLYYEEEQEFKALDLCCIYKERFHISQYEVVHYFMLSCPESDVIKGIYKETNSVCETIDIISDYNMIKAMLSIKYILNSIDNHFSAIIFENNIAIKKISSSDSFMKFNTEKYSSIVNILDYNSLEYYCITDDITPYSIIIIKEIIFKAPKVNKIEPNQLLKEIVDEVYGNLCGNVKAEIHQRINGIVANANSRYKTASVDELYNIIKYRFLFDENYIEFYNHKQFDTYIFNKIYGMIQNRKAKQKL